MVDNLHSRQHREKELVCVRARFTTTKAAEVLSSPKCLPETAMANKAHVYFVVFGLLIKEFPKIWGTIFGGP